MQGDAFIQSQIAAALEASDLTNSDSDAEEAMPFLERGGLRNLRLLATGELEQLAAAVPEPHDRPAPGLMAID